MNSEELYEFEEHLRTINDLLGQAGSSMSGILGAHRNAAGAAKDATNSVRDFAVNTGVSSNEMRAHIKVQGEQNQQIQDSNRRLAEFNQALNLSTNTLRAFYEAASSGQQGFAKYNRGLDSLGNTSLQIGKNFGTLGTVIGGVIQGFTAITGKWTEQTDNLLKFSDTWKHMGAIGGKTTKELHDMALQAGYTSRTMEKLNKPMATFSEAINIFGGNANLGKEAFMNMINISDETKKRFDRLGVTLEQANDMQAEYMKLQAMSGQSFKGTKADMDRLSKTSVEYAENLLVLARFAGTDADSVRKKQEAIALDARIGVMGQADTYDKQEITRRMESGQMSRTEGTAQIEKIESQGRIRDVLSRELSQRFGKEGAVGITAFAAGLPTASNEVVRGLLMRGNDKELGEIRAAYARGDEAEMKAAIGRLMDNDRRMIGKMSSSNQKLGGMGMGALISAIGPGVTGDLLKEDTYNSEEAKAASARMWQGGDAAAMARAKKDVEEAGKKGTSRSEDIRAELHNAERNLSVFVDKWFGESNPLTTGFNGLTLLLGGASAALAVFTATLGAGSVGNLGKGLFGRGAKAAGGAAAAAGAGKGALGSLGKLGKFAGRAGGALAVGIEGIDYVTGEKELSWRNLAKSGLRLGGGAIGGILGSAAGPLGTIAGGAGGYMAGDWLANTLLGEDDKKKPVARNKPKEAGEGETFENVTDDPYLQVALSTQKGLLDIHLALQKGMLDVTSIAFKKMLDEVRSQNLMTRGPRSKINENYVTEQEGIDFDTYIKSGIEANEKFLENLKEDKYAINKSTSTLTSTFEKLTPVIASVSDAMATLWSILTGKDKNEILNGPKSNTSGPGGPGTTSGATGNAKIAMDYFMGQGWSKEQAAGIVGNLQQESTANLDPSITNKTGHRGIAQWDKSRWANLEKFAKEKGMNPNDLNTQLQFIQKEMTEDGRVSRAMKGANTAAEAATAFENTFERSGGSAMDKRIGYAEALLKSQGDGGAIGRIDALGQAAGNAADRMNNTGRLKDQIGKLIRLGGGITGNAKNLDHLDSRFESAMVGMLTEYVERTGNIPIMTSGFRYPGDQARIDSGRNPKAKPGTSRHERGAAMDINSPDVRLMKKMGLLTKYGLTGIPNDPPHIQLKARNGGIVSGPDSGYPVEMHGTEAIIPLNKNSVLEKLAKMPGNLMKDKADAFSSLSGHEFSSLSSSIASILEKQTKTTEQQVEIQRPIQTAQDQFNRQITRLLEDNQSTSIELLSKLDDLIDAMNSTSDNTRKLVRKV